MTTYFRRWLADWLRSNRRRPPEFTTRAVTEWPKEPLPNILYRMGDAECEWAAGLQCPCGCRAFIQLSLVEDASPSWRVERKRSGEFTLMPSVWRTVGCRSHFIIYRSRILWCRADDPQFYGESELSQWQVRLAKRFRNP